MGIQGIYILRYLFKSSAHFAHLKNLKIEKSFKRKIYFNIRYYALRIQKVQNQLISTFPR